MALNATHVKHEREPLQFSVEVEKQALKELEKLVAESDANSLESLLQVLLVTGLIALVGKLANEAERVQLESLLRNAKLELHVVEHKAEVSIEERQPTLEELLAMPVTERRAYMERAAVLLEEEYRTNPELTITADATDLYDYPEN